jgi:hypothetical protein
MSLFDKTFEQSSSTLMTSIKNQAEYYMSDSNLKQDSFFNNKISSSEGGYIQLELLLNCNKMKKLTTSKDELLSAIQESEILELNTNKTLFRRKGNPTVPELNDKSKGNNFNMKVSTEKKSSEITIFNIKSSKEVEVKWKIIQEKILLNNPGLIISYLRFTNDSGHIGLSEAHKSLMVKSEFHLEQDDLTSATITISKCSSDDLVDFWKNHGEHLKMCLNREIGGKDFKNNKKGGSNKRNEEDDDKKDKLKKKVYKLRKPVTLGTNKFLDLKDIRQKSRNILNSIKEGEKALNHDENFLKDILKFHPNQEKGKDVCHFTSGQNPEYLESKCFIVVKTDGKKDDFSVNKCLDVLFEQHGSK